MQNKLQVLREIDKLDKIGLAGVCQMLGKGMVDASGAYNQGVGLNAIQIGMVEILFQPFDVNTDNALNQLTERLSRIGQIQKRFELVLYMKETVAANGNSLWQNFLALPVNHDDTWNHGGRPENLAWAVDDLLEYIGKDEENEFPASKQA